MMQVMQDNTEDALVVPPYSEEKTFSFLFQFLSFISMVY